MDLKATRLDTDGHVATVFLHRPHRHNAWTGRMHAEFRWVMQHLEDDPSVRVVVVTGTAPAFCVGGDSEALAQHAERGGYDTGLPPEPARPGVNTRPEFDDDFAWMYGYRTPILAAVNGAAAGVGLALALFADLRFGAAPAKLTTAAPKLGLPAEYGMSWVLPRLVGVTRAADLLLSGRTVTVAQTAEWGLWNEVLPDGPSALAAALDYARMLATTAGPTAVSTTKAQLYHDLHRHSAAGSVADSKRLLDVAMGTAEYREGVAALRERRPPRF
ncbi:MAG TPA: enoyl-CoA hydratase-related protein [Ilumatobacter sp.]